MKIEYNGHIMEFSDEGAKEFETVLCNTLEEMAPIYIKQALREKASTATAEELRKAIVNGASSEMAMFRLKFRD